jgi:type I restriction enzyme S subunit
MNNITIDKTHWKKYRFDEMVQNIAERVEPSQTDLDVYVGLEHIDPDCLHLSRHGYPSDVEGTKLRFYKGDIIFGRRRAYQRKTALATTDGICSAHAMVLRAKEEVVDSNFLPFLFHSKQFIDMAITISVGGLSPTINWKDISKQEFLLPPKDEQKRLAELLWAADEMIEKEKKELEKVKDTMRIELLQIGNYTFDSQLPLNSVCDILDNRRKPLSFRERDKIKGSYPYYGVNGIVDYINQYIFDDDLVLLAEDCGNYSNFKEEPIAYFITGKSWVNNHVHVLRAKEQIVISKWLYYSLAHKDIVKYINGSTRGKLCSSELSRIFLYVPTLEQQQNICIDIEQKEIILLRLQNQISFSQQLKQELINKIF